MTTILLMILLLLNILDIVTTKLILSYQGTVELNPFLRWTMNKIGVLPGLLSHKSVFAGILIFLYITEICGYKFNIGLFLFLDILYLYVVKNNFDVLKNLKDKIFKS